VPEIAAASRRIAVATQRASATARDASPDLDLPCCGRHGPFPAQAAGSHVELAHVRYCMRTHRAARVGTGDSGFAPQSPRARATRSDLSLVLGGWRDFQPQPCGVRASLFFAQGQRRAGALRHVPEPRADSWLATGEWPADRGARAGDAVRGTRGFPAQRRSGASWRHRQPLRAFPSAAGPARQRRTVRQRREAPLADVSAAHRHHHLAAGGGAARRPEYAPTPRRTRGHRALPDSSTR
jgi:hypothetical protein